MSKSKRVKLKVLPLEWWMKKNKERFDKMPGRSYIVEIKPVYNKPNIYLGFHPDFKEKIAWFETRGTAFKNSKYGYTVSDFNHSLACLNSLISDVEYDAMHTLHIAKRYDLFNYEAYRVEREKRSLKKFSRNLKKRFASKRNKQRKKNE